MSAVRKEEMVERVREAIENAVLASAIANEPFGAQAARAAKAALAASHHAELVEALERIEAVIRAPQMLCGERTSQIAMIAGSALGGLSKSGADS